MKTNVLPKLVTHLLSMTLTGLFLLPLWWMFSASLRTPGLPLPRELEWLPAAPTFVNYLRIFEILPLGKYLLNSFVVAFSGEGTPWNQRTGRRQTYKSRICRKATLSDRMPPPTGVVRGPLIPIRYFRKSSRV